MRFLDTFHSAVRPVVTYLLAVAFVVGFFMGMVPRDVFSSLVISVVSYWFGSRERNVAVDGALPVVAATSDTETIAHSVTTK